jgi:hypothetical protein
VSEQTETTPGTSSVVHHRVALVNGVRLHYVEAEPTRPPQAGSPGLCLALHGFPEFWYCWRHQIPALAAAGLSDWL